MRKRLWHWQETHKCKLLICWMCLYPLVVQIITIFLFNQVKCKLRISWVHYFIVRQTVSMWDLKIYIFSLLICYNMWFLIKNISFVIFIKSLWFLNEDIYSSLPKAPISYHLGAAESGYNHWDCHPNCPLKLLMGSSKPLKNKRRQKEVFVSFRFIFIKAFPSN